MSIEYPFSLAQLAQILSALENERRNPNTKRNAIKAIERNASQIGLSAEDVFDAADGLLSGRLSPAEWRAQLRDEGCGPASFTTEAAEPQPDGAAEPEEIYLMPHAGQLAVAGSGTGDAAAADLANAAPGAPVAATAAVAANLETTGKRVSPKELLLAACQAAEHWLQAERDRPGESRPDEILRVLRAAIARAEGQPRRSRQSHDLQRQRQPRAGSKESQVIAMLRRPEGATLAQIGESIGWQTHTIRGFFAAALKKRHGIAVTSEKPQGGERTYRIAE
ncbi:MAG: DUF3489 domain-containing protein [Rhodospirillales bacterium]|nr:DUF3489 domain-containing protein [Rhodospirillales bacterium]